MPQNKRNEKLQRFIDWGDNSPVVKFIDRNWLAILCVTLILLLVFGGPRLKEESYNRFLRIELKKCQSDETCESKVRSVYPFCWNETNRGILRGYNVPLKLFDKCMLDNLAR